MNHYPKSSFGSEILSSRTTRRRFYSPPRAFSPDRGSVRLAAEETRHLRDVLRLEPGDEVYVFDGEGREFKCRIEERARDSAGLRVLEEVSPARPESPIDLTLAIALLKGEKFDLVVQKATELGVTRMLPVTTERADVRLRDDQDAAKRVARWQRIAVEAAKQSGRARVPEVGTPATLAALLATAAEESMKGASYDLRLMFAERDGESLSQAIDASVEQPRRVIALIGSEGGWADEEIAHVRASSWRVVTLGGRILRAETAAIALAALLQHRFGDLT